MNTTSPESEASCSHSRSLRVAIADDDRGMRNMLQQMLEALGHQVVVVAADGRSLISGCSTANPDLIVTDNLMPDMSGLEVAALIQVSGPIPVIVVSGYCDRELVLSAEQQHVGVYLVKPISLEHLRTAIEQLSHTGDVALLEGDRAEPDAANGLRSADPATEPFPNSSQLGRRLPRRPR